MTETETETAIRRDFTAEAPVLRDISLQLTQRDWMGKILNVMAEAPPTTATREATEFIGACLPGKRIEYTHRSHLSDVIPKAGKQGVNVSSLFFQAVHECFAHHYPLALRPEVLWNLVLNEIATCVKLHPETYRDQFTTTADGKTVIDVIDNSLVFGSPDNNWGSTIGQFEDQLAKLVPGDTMLKMFPEFTTGSAESRTAGMVAFMAAASPYYEYRTFTMCGIPKIRLLGEARDYIGLLKHADVLAGMFKEHLGLYFERLIPVLHTLAGQAAGEPLDVSFWTNIYHMGSSSGSDYMNGWLTNFVNYTQKHDGTLQPRTDRSYRSEDIFGQLSHGSVPSQVYTCPFKWHYYEGMPGVPNSGVHDMLFIGGILGVDVEDGYVTPKASFGVLGG